MMGKAGSALYNALRRFAGRQDLKKNSREKDNAPRPHSSPEGNASREPQKTGCAYHDAAKRWLTSSRGNFSNPFFVLLSYLVSLEERLRDVAPVSCDGYENYFRKRCTVREFPFEIPFGPVERTGDIMQFISRFDHAYLSRMVQSVFIGLIAFLVRSRGRINLLDFGAGQTCGMYGEGGRFLFTEGKVDTDAVSFWAIDDLHEPKGSVFRKSRYRQCNILSFDPREKFDLITGHHVLEHCHDWSAVVGHVAGLLKKDGYLYLSFPRFGGFYDTVYRLMSPLDHCADFDLHALEAVAGRAGLEPCLTDVYVDPNGKFDWICSFYPELVDKQIADCFYDLCVSIDAKLLLGYHHYGYYVVFRKVSG